MGWIGAWYPDFVPDVRGEIEIGWTLRAPFRGQGHATEAARQAIAAAFEHQRPERVISLIAPGNDPRPRSPPAWACARPPRPRPTSGVILRVFELPRAD